MKYEKLFTPMNIGPLTIKNRIVMAPMLLGFANFNGTPTEQLLDYYEERAKGGTGLIITEITRVNDINGAGAFAQLGASQDYQIDGLRALADRVHAHGAKLFVQLHHPGRQNLGLLIGTVPMAIALTKKPAMRKMFFKVVPAGKWLMKKGLVPAVYAPSKCEPSHFSESRVRALSHKQVKQLVQQFADGAERLKKAGVDGVELHASHGYLIQQFLSPNTNKRTDEYGGSLENRMRFLLEIIEKIRARLGDYPIVVRLTVDECYRMIGMEGKGYELAEGIEMAKRLEQAGIDAIDVSSGAYDTFNYWLEPTTFDTGWRAYMAEAVKKAVKIPVLAANFIRSPEQAESQLERGVQDFVSLGRPHIADPHWAQKVESGHKEDVKRCIGCLYCIQSMQDNAYTGGHGLCAVNPLVGKEGASNLEKDGAGRTLVVVGAGVAGLTAAETGAKRGFKTIVLEKTAEAGGQILLANKPPKREKLTWCVDDLVTACQKAGAEIRYNTTATEDLIKKLNPYAVVIATGGVAVVPRAIEGTDRDNVYTSTQILEGSIKLTGKNVAVIGSGMTGLETAEMLASGNNAVTVVEMADETAPGVWLQHKDDIMPKLKAENVAFVTKEKLVAITDKGARLQSVGKKAERTLDADAVVLALGARPDNGLYKQIADKFEKVYLVGDAVKPARIADATRAAYETVASIK